MTKKGTVAKRQPPPHKDETGGFYSAQLIHYGLKPLKTKAPAKKALLAAFTKGENGKMELKVPERIEKLRDELREEYRVANEKARTEYKEEQRRQKEEEERRHLEREKRNAELIKEILGEEEASKSNPKKRKTDSTSTTTGSKKKAKAAVQAGFFPPISSHISRSHFVHNSHRLIGQKLRGNLMWSRLDCLMSGRTMGMVITPLRCHPPPRPANTSGSPLISV